MIFTTKTTVFLTGATGYIGGTVLQRLLEHTERNKFDITVLVREEGKAERLRQLGLKTEVGTLDDLDLVRQLAARADIVLNNASADHLPGIKAILSGMKERFEKTGRVPILIHTSGAGVFTNLEGDQGISPHTVYYDSEPEQMESLPSTRAHRLVDLEVVAADKKGYVRTHIVLPGTIYGLAAGPLAKLGIQHAHSAPLSQLVRLALRRGQTPAPERSLVWPGVDIEDVGDLYRVLFDAARKDVRTPHGREGYYVAENGEFSVYEVANELAGVLYWLGQGRSPEPEVLTDEERLQLKGPRLLSLTCRAVGDKSRSLGWRPTKTNEDLLASIVPEVLAVLAGQ
ncbi:NAD(P)-binding protein [Artomyces pyxidatus]|uniref:NAD(P)-binding protein n=1 Tax=Artomyces pyxidatus TaxID=48021 RepID=A0ACB8T8N6_9AGAM|nr:NAD(P)-binding protein [Artomyces pyxidatus]